MRLRDGCTVRLAGVVRNFCSPTRGVLFSLGLLAAWPGLALSAPDSAVTSTPAAAPSRFTIEGEKLSTAQVEQREMNHYRLREWRRMMDTEVNESTRRHALYCAQTIGSDIGYWRPEDDPACELPWLGGRTP